MFGSTAESYAGKSEGVDFDSTHKIIGSFIDVLQNNFREDTNYKRPMMPPQANIIFALDGDVANDMIIYMSAKLKDVCGFEEDEFRFTRKSSSGNGELQRVRLEFTKGVTVEIIRKVVIATDELEKILQRNSHN